MQENLKEHGGYFNKPLDVPPAFLRSAEVPRIREDKGPK